MECEKAGIYIIKGILYKSVFQRRKRQRELQKSLVGDDGEGHESIQGMKKQFCHVEEVDQTSTSPGDKQL